MPLTPIPSPSRGEGNHPSAFLLFRTEPKLKRKRCGAFGWNSTVYQMSMTKDYRPPLPLRERGVLLPVDAGILATSGIQSTVNPMTYLTLKYLHILFGIIVVGTGFGIAFFQWITFRSKNIEAIKIMTRHVVLADWLFTAPAVLGQFVTGMLLVDQLHYNRQSTWVMTVIALYTFVGFCWFPVLIIQYKLRKLAETQADSGVIDQKFMKLMRIWTALGIPTFATALVILWLMVAKPLAVS
jgi:uncharacterized membrane protein